MLQELKSAEKIWDIIVVGGGATGLGIAVDATSRGYKTLLLEQSDFAKGTSSRSTKLIHGGVRYLQQGNVSLVLEALHERGLLLKNAPHLVHNQSFIVPVYDWWEGPFYGVGLKLYDMLAGKLGFGPSKQLSRTETIKKIPNIEQNGLRGGVIYFDGQFDDSRLAINLAQTAINNGGTLLNYMAVTSLMKTKGGMINGVHVRDEIGGDSLEVLGRVVINAAGIFVEDIIRMDNPNAEKIIAHSQGAHLVIDKKFLPGKTAIMVPHTDDGRVLFAVPWENKVLIGTTDTSIPKSSLEPRALEREINFILRNANRYLSEAPEKKDILSIFAGIRPLFSTERKGKKTAQISRDHVLLISNSGLVTITGGKWTTYRKMAEDTVNQSADIAGLEPRLCKTKNLRIHGWMKNIDDSDPLHSYGSDAIKIKRLINKNATLGEKIHPQLPYLKAEVVWATREEMAMTVEDVLSRRTRALLLDAKTSIEMAPIVAQIMNSELKHDKSWEIKQIKEYSKLANNYLP